MTWAAQVVHVMRKDVRSARWYVLAYLVLLVLGGYTAVHGRGAGHLALPFLTVVAAMLALAGAVQADSPTRPDAFWLTRPLDTSAVFGAKLSVLLVLVVTGLIAQAYALIMHATSAADFALSMGTSALVLCSSLTFALAAAAVTRDVGGFFLLSLGLLVASSLILTVAGIPESTEPSGWLTPALIVILPALLAAWVYRTRDARRGMRLVLGTVVLASTISVVQERLRPAADRTTAFDRPSAGPAEGVMDVDGIVRGQGQIRLYATLPDPEAPPAYAGMEVETRTVLYPRSVILEDSDGTTRPLRLVFGTASSAEYNSIWQPPYTSDDSSPLPLTQLDVLESDHALLLSGGARVVVEGEVGVERISPLGVLDLGGKSTLARNGIRMQVVPGSLAPPAQVAITVSGVSGRADDYRYLADYRFNLVPLAVGAAPKGVEMRRLQPQSSGTGALVLPGDGWYMRATVQPMGDPSSLSNPRDMGGPRVRAAESLLRAVGADGAGLHVSRWQETGRYRVRITASYEPEGP